MKISVFIIDDEAPSRRELRYLLEQMRDVVILGEASNPSQGLRGIRETRPQLVFLDIQLPGLNGIELAQIIRELPDKPLIIFATAFEQFAVQAFNVEAFDYILKPFTLERVAKSIHKAVMALRKEPVNVSSAPPEEDHEHNGREKHDIKRILVHKKGKLIPIAPERIVYIKRNEGQVVVRTAEESFTITTTMSELENILEAYALIRVHRNALVNLNCITEIIPWFNGSCKLVMNTKDACEILVSRNNTKCLKNRLLLGR